MNPGGARDRQGYSGNPGAGDGTLIEVLKQVNAEVNPDEVLARLSLSGDSTAPQAAASSTATETPAGRRRFPRRATCASR